MIELVSDLVSKQGVDGVLCIGVPTIHEAMVGSEATGVKSFLLDLDVRLVSLVGGIAMLR